MVYNPAFGAANVDVGVHVSADFLGVSSDMTTVTSPACGASVRTPMLHVEEASRGSAPLK